MALGHPSLACIEAMLIAASQIEPPVHEPVQISKKKKYNDQQPRDTNAVQQRRLK